MASSASRFTPCEMLKFSTREPSGAVSLTGVPFHFPSAGLAVAGCSILRSESRVRVAPRKTENTVSANALFARQHEPVANAPASSDRVCMSFTSATYPNRRAVAKRPGNRSDVSAPPRLERRTRAKAWAAASYALLDPPRPLLPELRHLRRNHELAIRLLGITLEVLLVIALGQVELRRRRDLGHDRRRKRLVGGEFADELLGLLLLRPGVVEDRGAVLRADVVALAVGRGGIVDGEKYLQQLAIRDDRRIVGDAHHLGVACVALAHARVSRVRRISARVARLDADHALESVVYRFQAPETAACERRNFPGSNSG